MLGRRTSKRVVYGDSAEAEETHFRWEGLRLVQERRGGCTRSYVYDPDEHDWVELTALTLPDKTTLQWLHYGSGHVSVIRCNTQGLWIN